MHHSIRWFGEGCLGFITLPYYIIRDGGRWLWGFCLNLLALPILFIVYGLFGPQGLFGEYGPFGSAIHEDGSTCVTYTYCDDCGAQIYTTARAARRHKRRCKP